jgi:Family of unknown function (DUF5320)
MTHAHQRGQHRKDQIPLMGMRQRKVNHMPMGDCTGPMGEGPVIASRAGCCAGYPMAAHATAVPRMGMGPGCRGGGRGWRHVYYGTPWPGWTRFGYPPPPPAKELESLQAGANWLKGQLDAINQRIEGLKPK